MPAPISVSPRGGPQPAKQTAAAVGRVAAKASRRAADDITQVIGGGSQVPEYFGSGLTNAIVRAATNVARRAGQPRPPAPLSLDTPAPSTVGPPAGFVPPTAGEISTFMEDLYAGAQRGTITRDQFGSLLGPVMNRVNQDGQAKSLDSVIMAAVGQATGPEGLASMLGRSPEELAPLLGAAAERAGVDTAIDTSITQATNRRTAPPTRPGGQTADSVDRAGVDADGDGVVDPLTYATEVPMTSADLEAMILALQNRRADEAPARLNEAKRLIMEQTAQSMARAEELGAAYRAGLGNSSIQGPLPGANESTAQSQYTTAAPVRAAAAPLNGFLAGIDPVEAENQILQTAYAIEQDRKAAAEDAMLASLEEQFKARAAEEGELEDIVASEQKAADKAAREQERKNAEARAVKVWTQQRRREVVDAIDNKGARADNAVNFLSSNDTLSGQEIVNKLAARFRAGDGVESAVKAVFGPDVTTADLNVPALNAIQVARVLAGGDIPDELRTRATTLESSDGKKRKMTLDEFLAAALDG